MKEREKVHVCTRGQGEADKVEGDLITTQSES